MMAGRVHRVALVLHVATAGATAGIRGRGHARLDLGSAQGERGSPSEGQDGCKCYMAGLYEGRSSTIEGHYEFEVRGVKVEYPKAVGGYCGAWDQGIHPRCKGDDQAEWCHRRWCFVDPCTCNLATPPKHSAMKGVEKLAGGHPVYYSYATCGEKDTRTAETNADACAVQVDKEACHAHEKCGWSHHGGHGHCLHRELHDACGFDFDAAARHGFRGALVLSLVLAIGAAA